MYQHGLDLFETTPTYKSFGKHKGRHYISTLDQIYVSNTIPAGADAMPDAATDHFPVIGRLKVLKAAAKPTRKTLEVVTATQPSSDGSVCIQGRFDKV